MKKLYTILAGLILTASVFAQAPEKMSYQAVIRDASNNLTTNQAVGMQISILQTTATGTAVYVERQTPTTNANGLVSLEIGTGTVISGDFTTIDWTAGPYFIKTETDLNGGANYTITGTSQLLSVPYALHAKTAESITGTVNYTETDPIFGASVAIGITAADTANWNNHTIDTDTHIDSTGIAGLGYVAGAHTVVTAGTNVTVTGNGTTANPYVVNATGGGNTDKFYLGQDTLGGIVYYIYKDASGTQHGLIVNKTESTAVWQASGTLTNANRTEDGAYNTALMTNSAAANYVNGLTDGGFTDWYLPSIDELGLLYYNRFTTNKALRAGGFTLLSKTATYWSSTEYGTTSASNFNFYYGNANVYLKNSTLSVRAVRAF